MRQRDLRGEGLSLVVAWRVVVVVVEAALADGNRPDRTVEQVADRVDAVARLVRVQPDRRPDLGEPAGDVEGLDRRRPIAPTVTIVVTSAAVASATRSAAASAGRWQCESSQPGALMS